MRLRRGARRQGAPRKASPQALPRVYASVMVRSRAGKPRTRPRVGSIPKNFESWLPTKDTLNTAAGALRRLGLTVDYVARTHLNISGDPSLFERVFKVKLTRRTYPIFTGQRSGRRELRYEADRRLTVPTELRKLVDSVDLAPRFTFHVSSKAAPPALSYDHMEVPDDVARAMDAIKAKEHNITGQGIAVAMVDSGFMADRLSGGPPFHPYYLTKGYSINNVVPLASPADARPGDDGVGHGTGTAACLLAVAPGVNLTVYKAVVYDPSGQYINPPAFSQAFSQARDANPAIISCSWSCDFDPALELAIFEAVTAGIVVLFSVGNYDPSNPNDTDVRWPASDKNVIAVGGAYLGGDDSLIASDIALSGTPPVAPGRDTTVDPVGPCPDVCGLAGTLLQGQTYDPYIALPTQPGSDYDYNCSSLGDATSATDGWLVASGTSLAAAMVAGVCALMMQQNPTLRGNPPAVRAALMSSCSDVTAGVSGSGDPAAPGPDVATGAGLAQGYRAVNSTDIWMRDNPDSDVGLVPTTGRRPAWPPFAFWTSPDVKIVSAPLANPQADFDAAADVDPIFGQDNYVCVRARNRGTQAAAQVTVGLFYADPSTNLSFPADWNDGTAGNGTICVNGVLSNSQTFASIAADGSAVAPAPFVWQPPAPSTATQSQILSDGRVVGHFCLLTRVSSADDPILFPGGGESSVNDDNNISMKNVHVYSAPGGTAFPYHFIVRGDQSQTRRREFTLSADLSGLPARARIALQIPTKRVKAIRVVRARRAPARGKRRRSVRPQPVILGTVALRAREDALAHVTVRLPRRAKAGDYRVHVVQSMGRQAVGGVTLVSRLESAGPRH